MECVSTDVDTAPRPDFVGACSRFDGTHYREIVEQGYSYNASRRSTVAFFPIYPMIARLVATLTGLSAPGALLLVSNLLLVGAFIIFSAYVRLRFPMDTARQRLFPLALEQA